MDQIDRAIQIVKNNNFLCLGVVCSGSPWTAPVFFAVDGAFDFLFISDPRSNHGRALLDFAPVSWSIFYSARTPEETDGLQFSGTGRDVVSLDEINAVQRALYQRRFPKNMKWQSHIKDPHYFQNADSPQRLYSLRVTGAWILDRDHPKGTQRLELDVTQLRNRWQNTLEQS